MKKADKFFEALVEQVDSIPRCKYPVGSYHDWGPSTSSSSVCAKCHKRLMLVGTKLVLR